MKPIRWIQSLIIAFAICLAALPALAVNREKTVESLEPLLEGQDNGKLQVWLNEARGKTSDRLDNMIRLNSTYRYHLIAQEGAYLTLLHVDPYGVVSVLLPGGDGAKIEAGEPLTIPPESTPSLAGLPLGDEDLFALLTREPLPSEVLGGEDQLIDETEAPTQIRKVAEQARAAGLIAAAQVRSRVIGRVRTRGRNATPEIVAEDIVEFFTSPRTRGFRRQRANFPIHFDFNSAELDSAAKVQLDEVGAALAADQLAGFSFMVAGHTDVRGSRDYNVDLSQRRAEAVQQYLVNKHSIDAGRLTMRGFGPSEPMQSDDSDEAHAMNRRVEFQKVDP